MEGEKSMSTRERLLSTLRAYSKNLNQSGRKPGNSFEMPDLSTLNPTVFSDPVGSFIENVKTVSGAKVIELKEGDDLNAIIRNAYPEAKSIGSNLPAVKATVNPDTVGDARELMSVDVGVVEGKIGVAENGCIWIPQTMKEKAVCFASEYLVILVRRQDIVSNMHEAYKRIEQTPEFFEPYKFGTFISGPSKTADIESALVYGAQAARGVTVILL